LCNEFKIEVYQPIFPRGAPTIYMTHLPCPEISCRLVFYWFTFIIGLPLIY
jgi:hypothetical protein